MFSIIDGPTARFFGDGEVEIECDLPPSEAARRLDEHVEPLIGFHLGKDLLVGRVHADRLAVSRRRPMLRNAWRPVLRAQIEETEDGCQIRGRYTLMRPVILFMLFWFGMVLTTGGVALVAVVGSGGAANALAILGVAAGMLAFGVVLVAVGMYVGKSDTDEIESRLRRHLNDGP